ncbi:MAG: insulinase family protein [Thiotrichales bacterium]|nr:insulinase family protein [Thiotrichales bacterium]MBT3613272.1 insulinase family protein [Thiotrichales bacterium]MBT3751823.1 insulinase family protein [Thiotrichales bacterium]MBT3838046.1 insulinase family protein [Thiotrichales bacterium]MBT4152041.1 insulinase family protein [Thiotrichales bacterium]
MSLISKSCSLYTAALLLVTTTVTAVEKETVTEVVLSNGLKVLVKEDHRAPVVVSQIWYKVGASYEVEGITGLSHMLEHMMFKGTEKHGPNEFSEIISVNGGRENAFTGADYTAYFQRLEKSRLEISMELESDRMRNLTLPEEEFIKEREVVQEERRMRTDDKPTSLTYEQFMATAFQTSPYHNPVIGWMNDIENYTVADMRSWYEKWYAPNNATLVIAGDVDPVAVIEMAKKYYGPLQRSDLVPPKPRVEIEQLGPREVVVKVPAKLPYLIMGFPTPSVVTAEEEWEPYALEVMAYILDGGDSSRLGKHLVRGTEIAASAGAGYDLYDRLQTLFLVDGVPSDGHTVAEIKSALLQELKELKINLVTKRELDIVKAKVVADKVFEQDSVFYQAMQMGELETVGLSWREADRYAELVRKVTAEQVMAVANKYIILDRVTTAILDPLPLESSKPAPSSEGDSNE